MTVWQRITREPTTILATVTALTGLLILFGVPLSVEQAGGILTLVGALIGLVRLVVTPAAEVVVQRKPGARAAVAGPASPIKGGTAVVVRRLVDPD